MVTLRLVWVGVLTILTVWWIEVMVQVLWWIESQHPDGQLAIMLTAFILGSAVGLFLIASTLLSVLKLFVAITQPQSRGDHP